MGQGRWEQQLREQPISPRTQGQDSAESGLWLHPTMPHTCKEGGKVSLQHQLVILRKLQNGVDVDGGGPHAGGCLCALTERLVHRPPIT